MISPTARAAAQKTIITNYNPTQTHQDHLDPLRLICSPNMHVVLLSLFVIIAASHARQDIALFVVRHIERGISDGAS